MDYLHTPLTIALWLRYKVQSLAYYKERTEMKAERNLTVYEMSGYHYKPTPTIMLKGQWLADLGFEAGDRIKVCCEDGRITILPTSPQEGENPGHKSVSVKKM